jgi:flagellin
MDSQKAMARSLARLSSGSKIITASDDAAGLAVSSRLESQLRRIDAVIDNLGNAMSLSQTQDGYLKNIGDAFTRMSELAMMAQDNTKADDDRKLYDEEFKQLIAYVTSSLGKNFNGVPLFDTTGTAAGIDITIDEDGNTFTINPIDVTVAAYSDALTHQPNSNPAPPYFNLETAINAKVALTTVTAALKQFHLDRAGMGAIQTRIEFTMRQLTDSKQNLSEARSRITDVDIAEETTEFASKQILVQAGTSMLREANNLPRTALELLR